MEFFIYNYGNNPFGELESLDELLKQDNISRKFEEGVYSINSGAFRLEVDGKILLNEKHYFGQLNLIAFQLEAAADLLEKGCVALIRAANLNIAEGPFLSFEPDGDTTLVSFFYIQEAAESNFYPIDGVDGDNAANLYQFFNNNKENLLVDAQGTVFHTQVIRVPFQTTTLINNFRRDASLVRQLYDRLQIEMDKSFYFDMMY